MTYKNTYKKSYFVFISILLLLCSNFSTIIAYAVDTSNEPTTEAPQTTEYPDEPGKAPDLVSDSAIVMDAETGQILYAKDPYSKRYPASITKIMTALVALERGNLNSTVTFSENAIWGIERDSSHIALDVGETLTLEQALYATLVVSANEAAWGVAEHIAGSLDSFCDLMNDKADEIGCINTHFVNANGLHDDNHYTCAYDMALIAKAAIANPKFVEMTSATYYEIPPTNLQPETRYLYQNNKLIKDGSDYYYPYCIGGKTGFTDQALGTLVSWAEKDGRTLICVVMHTSPTGCTYTDTTALYEYCFNNFSLQTPFSDFEFSDDDILSAEKYLNEYYNGHNEGKLTLEADIEDISMYCKEDSSSLTTELIFSDVSLEDGIIGELSIQIDGYESMSVPLYYDGYIYAPNPSESAEAMSEGYPLRETESEDRIKHPIALAIIIVILLATTVLCIYSKYINHKRNERNKRWQHSKSSDNRRR